MHGVGANQGDITQRTVEDLLVLGQPFKHDHTQASRSNSITSQPSRPPPPPSPATAGMLRLRSGRRPDRLVRSRWNEACRNSVMGWERATPTIFKSEPPATHPSFGHKLGCGPGAARPPAAAAPAQSLATAAASCGGSARHKVAPVLPSNTRSDFVGDSNTVTPCVTVLHSPTSRSTVWSCRDNTVEREVGLWSFCGRFCRDCSVP